MTDEQYEKYHADAQYSDMLDSLDEKVEAMDEFELESYLLSLGYFGYQVSEMTIEEQRQIVKDNM